MDRAETTRARALDDAVRPAAWAVSLSTAALGAAVTGCLVLGALAVHRHDLAPQLLAVVALVPLALGDVVGPLPAAAGALVRGAHAAARLRPLLQAPPAGSPRPVAEVTPDPLEEITPQPGARVSTAPRAGGHPTVRPPAATAHHATHGAQRARAELRLAGP